MRHGLNTTPAPPSLGIWAEPSWWSPSSYGVLLPFLLCFSPLLCVSALFRFRYWCFCGVHYRSFTPPLCLLCHFFQDHLVSLEPAVFSVSVLSVSKPDSLHDHLWLHFTEHAVFFLWPPCCLPDHTETPCLDLWWFWRGSLGTSHLLVSLLGSTQPGPSCSPMVTCYRAMWLQFSACQTFAPTLSLPFSVIWYVPLCPKLPAVHRTWRPYRSALSHTSHQ